MKTGTQRYLLIALTGFLCMGVSKCPGTTPATLNCQPPPHVTVLRGQSGDLTNPCDSHQWSVADYIEFDDDLAPLGVTLSTGIVGSNVTRTLSVDANAPIYSDRPFNFIYSRAGQWGRGTILLTTGIGVQVTASANPLTIMPGQTSQLTANATGGVPPYSYTWSPAGSLSSANIPKPIASPTNNTTYTVTVTDSQNPPAVAFASVSVTVNLTAVVSANPPVVDPSQPVQLAALPSGGIGPYSFAWTPFAPLNNATIFNPGATPLVTTTFKVTVTDAQQTQITGSVLVKVNLKLAVSATPLPIAPGQSSQLTATATGGSPPYSYHWTPPAGLSNADILNPVATPASTTAYTATVTDGAGTQAQGSITVFVGSQAGPTARLSLSWLNAAVLRADASASTPGTSPIVRYEFTSAFFGDPNQPYEVCQAPVGFPSLNCFNVPNPGIWDFFAGYPQTVRLRVIDLNGLSTTTTQNTVPPPPL